MKQVMETAMDAPLYVQSYQVNNCQHKLRKYNIPYSAQKTLAILTSRSEPTNCSRQAIVGH